MRAAFAAALLLVLQTAFGAMAFGGLGGMAVVAGWWGVWDIVAGLCVATLWGMHTTRRTGSRTSDASRHARSGQAR